MQTCKPILKLKSDKYYILENLRDVKHKTDYDDLTREERLFPGLSTDSKIISF